MPNNTTNINVLHLSSEKTWRGGEQQIAYLLDSLAERGVTNYVAARKGSVFEEYCHSRGIPVLGLPFKNSLDLKTAAAIRSFCRQNPIDIIHLHSARSHSIGVMAAWMGNKVPMILSRRVDFVPKKSWFTRWKYNQPSIKKILCVSDKIRLIMQAYVRDPSKCITVYSGIDLSKFEKQGAARGNNLKQEFNLSPETILIGNTAALVGHKDYYTFINTIGYLVEEGLPVKALIFGKGELEQSLKNYVSEKNLGQYVFFAGFRKDIVSLLPELHVFLMTSNEEGLGTSILDAFASGVPVVATEAGGIPEMVIHEKTGLLAPIAHPEELARQVKRVVTDDALRKKLIRGAREKVKDFSKENTAAGTLQAYKEVLGRI